MFAVLISAVSALLINFWIRRREEKRKKQVLRPLRELALLSVCAAHGEAYGNFQAFGEQNYKRLETRISRLQDALAGTRAELTDRTVGRYTDIFVPDEQAALFAYVGSINASWMTPTSTPADVRISVDSINGKMEQFSSKLSGAERELVDSALWSGEEIDDLQEPLFLRFKSVPKPAVTLEPVGAATPKPIGAPAFFRPVFAPRPVASLSQQGLNDERILPSAGG